MWLKSFTEALAAKASVKVMALPCAGHVSVLHSWAGACWLQVFRRCWCDEGFGNLFLGNEFMYVHCVLMLCYRCGLLDEAFLGMGALCSPGCRGFLLVLDTVADWMPDGPAVLTHVILVFFAAIVAGIVLCVCMAALGSAGCAGSWGLGFR